jgi:hypothetical protein
MNKDKVTRAIYIVQVFEDCKEYFMNKKNNKQDLELYAEASNYLDVLANRI